MHESMYDQLAQVEDRLWWHQSRRALIRRALARFRFPRDAMALDIGCGTGGALSLLREFTPRVIGIDRSARAVEWARRKNPESEVREGDANELERMFAPASVDLIALLNVLEHAWIPDEAEILGQVFRLLKPGGVVLITSAAYQSLSRRHDQIAMSLRRHTAPVMRQWLREAGFEGLYDSYFNVGSLPLAWMSAQWYSRSQDLRSTRPLRELSVPPWAVNQGMRLLMAAERALVRLFGRLPFGLSLICVAQKPGAVADDGKSAPSLRSLPVAGLTPIVGLSPVGQQGSLLATKISRPESTPTAMVEFLNAT